MGFNLRKYCKIIILNWLLPRLLARKCCNTIPTSGKDAKVVNCYVIYLRTIDGELLYLANGVDTRKNELYVNSLNTEDKTFSVADTIPLSSILTKKITVNHYYKGFCIHYDSLYDLFAGYVTKRVDIQTLIQPLLHLILATFMLVPTLFRQNVLNNSEQ
jgi:hypothetical protein